MFYSDQLEKDIKEIKVQGATNIALYILDSLKSVSEKTGNDANRLESIGKRLAYARPTEPLAQNAIRYIFRQKGKPVEFFLAKIDEYKNLITDSKNKMGEEGFRLIEEGGTYLTHCHSSTVVSMMIKARQNGKKFSVIATETRPLFQGRKTVSELISGGIEDVTLTIDDAAISLILEKRKRISAVFIGADLLDSTGFINKVGSLGIAYAAKSSDINVYAMSILLKYASRPINEETIEMRSRDEIWSEAPEQLKIYSPAFDFIPYNPAVKIVTENGVIEGSDIPDTAKSTYPFLE